MICTVGSRSRLNTRIIATERCADQPTRLVDSIARHANARIVQERIRLTATGTTFNAETAELAEQNRFSLRVRRVLR